MENNDSTAKKNTIPTLETQHKQQISEEQEAVQAVKQSQDHLNARSTIADDETDTGKPYGSNSKIK